MGFSHILITRPEAESAQLAEALADTGLVPVIMPSHGFVPAHPGFDFSGIWRHDGRKLAIFTSKRAVEFGLRQLPAGFFEGVEVAAIGPATARALEAAGRRVSLVPGGGFTSEAFLGQPNLAAETGEAMIFAAPGGREALQQGLEHFGWRVRMAFVYERVALPPKAGAVAELRGAESVISAWTSANAMEVLAESLPADIWAKVLAGVCIATSARLRDRLLDAGAQVVSVVDGPGNEAIRERVLELI